MQKLKSDNNFMAYSWIVLGVLARLIPHPPNVSPLNGISLFGGAHLNRKQALFTTLLVLVASDLLLALVKGYAPFGLWSLFTYSGLLAISFAGSFLQNRRGFLPTLAMLVGSSFGFWLWTNFGLWLTGDHGMYPHTAAGLVACFEAALPFLQNSLLGDLAWGFAFFAAFQGVRNAAPRFGYQIQSA